MNEAEWLACSDPRRLLLFLGDRITERKLRLFACACCRLHWDLLPDPRSRRAVEVAEKFADQLVTASEVSRAVSPAWDAHLAMKQSWATAHAARTLSWHIRQSTEQTVVASERQADLLRHIAGNPWRPLHIDDGHPDNWHVYPDDIQAVFLNGPFPATVTLLAEALYRGEDCAFALHDVLVECGQDELAQHFREPVGHPKGCAWLDAILGKE